MYTCGAPESHPDRLLQGCFMYAQLMFRASNLLATAATYLIRTRSCTALARVYMYVEYAKKGVHECTLASWPLVGCAMNPPPRLASLSYSYRSRLETESLGCEATDARYHEDCQNMGRERIGWLNKVRPV